VLGRDGRVEVDPQRDHLYTERLAQRLCEIWPTLATLMTTHVAAWVAWRALERALGTTDPFRIVRTPPSLRRIPVRQMLDGLARAQRQAAALTAAGACHARLPETPAQLLDAALDTFGRYHRSRAISRSGDDILVEDPRLCLYYRNRAAFADLEGP
jgi:hypothetical protein